MADDEGRDWESYVPHIDGGPVCLGPGLVTEWRSDSQIEIDFTGEQSGRPDDWEFPLTKLDWCTNHDELVTGGPHLDKLQCIIYRESRPSASGSFGNHPRLP
jgi:peptide/nickel transport system substrate-binding protein